MPWSVTEISISSPSASPRAAALEIRRVAIATRVRGGL